MKKKYVVWGLILLFVFAFYWVEFSPWSSTALQNYNNGYGTFDMKSYDAQKVYTVLSDMEPQGFTIYERYFIGDFLIVIGLGGVQILLSLVAYGWAKARWIKGVAIGVPIARGIFDVIENVLLLIVLLGYPTQYPDMIKIASRATTMKLVMIKIWIALILVGLVIKASKRILGKKTAANS